MKTSPLVVPDGLPSPATHLVLMRSVAAFVATLLIGALFYAAMFALLFGATTGWVWMLLGGALSLVALAFGLEAAARRLPKFLHMLMYVYVSDGAATSTAPR